MSETTPRYTVITFEGMSQKELYDKVLVTANAYYVSPQNVLSVVDSKSITINGISSDVVYRTKMHTFDVNYTVTFEFKDEKIKINSPTINKISTYTHKFQEMFICERTFDIGTGDRFTIFKPKNGSVNLPMAKETLENFINKLIDDIVYSGLSQEDDW